MTDLEQRADTEARHAHRELVERLRLATVHGTMTESLIETKTITEAADRIERLEAENARLLAALWEAEGDLHEIHAGDLSEYEAIDKIIAAIDGEGKSGEASRLLVEENDALEAENARLREALGKAANRLDWCAGIIPIDSARDKASEWSDEARAAQVGEDT